jgi:hypothetical protein
VEHTNLPNSNLVVSPNKPSYPNPNDMETDSSFTSNLEIECEAR